MADPGNPDRRRPRADTAARTLTWAFLGTLVILLVSPVSRPYLVARLSGAETNYWLTSPDVVTNRKTLASPENLAEASLIIDTVGSRMDGRQPPLRRDEVLTALEIAQAAAEQDEGNSYWWRAQFMMLDYLGEEEAAEAAMAKARSIPKLESYREPYRRRITEGLAAAAGRPMLWHALVAWRTINEIPSRARPHMLASLAECLPALSFFFVIVIGLASAIGSLARRLPATALYTAFGLIAGLLIAGIANPPKTGFGWFVFLVSPLFVWSIWRDRKRFREYPARFRLTTSTILLLAIPLSFLDVWPFAIEHGANDLARYAALLLAILVTPLADFGSPASEDGEAIVRHLRAPLIIASGLAVLSTLALLATEESRMYMANQLISGGTSGL